MIFENLGLHKEWEHQSNAFVNNISSSFDYNNKYKDLLLIHKIMNQEWMANQNHMVHYSDWHQYDKCRNSIQ